MTPKGRGRLKMYLGYAAGVGKTYQMLEDAQELRHQGVDVVVAYFEAHGRQDTIELEYLRTYVRHLPKKNRTRSRPARVCPYRTLWLGIASGTSWIPTHPLLSEPDL